MFLFFQQTTEVITRERGLIGTQTDRRTFRWTDAGLFGGGKVKWRRCDSVDGKVSIRSERE